MAAVRFYGALRDFLPRSRRAQWLYPVTREPRSLGDALESLGVPHPEIARVEVNGKRARLSRSVHEEDRIRVYPGRLQWKQRPRFILDVHLGKLVRFLRLAGFDSLYQNHWDDHKIAEMAARQKRWVLTRDVGLLKFRNVRRGLWLRETDPPKQWEEVIRRLHLRGSFRPFTRCLSCNDKLTPVEKKKIQDQLEPRTRQHYHRFFQCCGCGKIYWAGSHFPHLQERLKAGQRKGR